ncbi:MAG: OPT/YSL family transporter [Deltaproteobacteria bacterium]
MRLGCPQRGSRASAQDLGLRRRDQRRRSRGHAEVAAHPVRGILGANPRRQVIAQLLGVLVGAAVVVPAFEWLVPNASALGTERLPAPAAMVWAGVSRVLANGVGGMPGAARVAALIGLAAGAVLAAIEQIVSPRARRFVPSASGLGIAMVMPGASSLSMCGGALFAAERGRRRAVARARRGLTLHRGALRSRLPVARTVLPTERKRAGPSRLVAKH